VGSQVPLCSAADCLGSLILIKKNIQRATMRCEVFVSLQKGHTLQVMILNTTF
jgi:hypothetical protein